MKHLMLIPLLLAATIFAADEKPKDAAAAKPKPVAETYTDAKSGGQDYIDQGEYKNDWGGAQVIALGDDKFRMVSYKGGLPGDGWDKEYKQEVNGKRAADGKVVFTSTNNYRAELAAGKITINSDAGGPWTMEKTERHSPTEGAKPPAGAIILFDGKSADVFEKGKMDEHGLLMPGCTSVQKFGSFRLHIEFRLPYQPEDRGQARGNSGVYMQGRYEVQMLDSFGLEGKNNECGGLYELRDPDQNMCFPPLAWQTYDIDYTAAKYEGNKPVAPPRITVSHNGVTIHNNVALPIDRGTRSSPVKPGPEPGPIYLQDHGSPVRYRNIWLVETR